MKIIGHRGARGLAPENTIAAIEAGIAAGADMVEVDVRVTKDGVAVLFHDRTLHGLNINGQRLNEIRAGNPQLATLSEAIKAVGKRVPMVIEVKPSVVAEPVIRVLKQFLKEGWRNEDFFIASFDFALLRRLHAALPDVPTVVLERWSGVRAAHRAKRLGTLHICMSSHVIWREFVRGMDKAGFKLWAFTVNKPDQAAHWERYGLQAVVTDFPDRLKQS